LEIAISSTIVCAIVDDHIQHKQSSIHSQSTRGLPASSRTWPR
jgi:hypothetical protein